MDKYGKITDVVKSTLRLSPNPTAGPPSQMSPSLNPNPSV